MKKSHFILLSLALLLPIFESSADPTPTPTIMYKHNGGYIKDSDAKQLIMFINQIQDQVLAGDPSPQPSINFNLVTERVPRSIVSQLIRSGVFIEKRSTCHLMKESFTDRYGNFLIPKWDNHPFPDSAAEEAIACGCEMLNAGFGIADSQIAANNIFHRGKSCINF